MLRNTARYRLSWHESQATSTGIYTTSSSTTIPLSFFILTFWGRGAINKAPFLEKPPTLHIVARVPYRSPSGALSGQFLMSTSSEATLFIDVLVERREVEEEYPLVCCSVKFELRNAPCHVSSTNGLVIYMVSRCALLSTVFTRCVVLYLLI